MNGKIRKFAVALLALSVVLTGTVAALNITETSAPNPMVKADSVTVAAHDRATMDSPLEYEADDGSIETLPATVNRSSDVEDLGTGTVNPFSFYATDINFSDAGQFPRKSEGDNAASALDASEWTTSGAAVSDVETAPGVSAVEFDASAAGDSATYSNFSITSDVEKRYLQLAYDVESASASTVNLTLHDATDGDTAVVQIYKATGNTSAESVGANSTGDGKVLQVQIGTLAVSGGDGTLDEIGSIEVAADGAANVDFSAINAEKLGEWKFGVKKVDTDSEDDLETKTITEPTGKIEIHSLSTMGSTFDDATIHYLSFPAHFRAADLSGDAVSTSFTDAKNYPGFGKLADVYYRLELPSAYDLSYSGLSMTETVELPGERYITVEYAEGVSDSTAFEDIEDSQYTSKTSAYDSEGTEVTLDSTISPGDDLVMHYEVKLTSEEASNWQSSSGGGGAGAMGGGLSSLPLIGGIVVILLGIVRKFGG